CKRRFGGCTPAMAQYDDIIASYLEKQAALRAQLRLLRAGEKRPGQRMRSAEQAAIQRMEREIRDLEDAIARCRGRAGRPRQGGRRPPAPSGAQAGAGLDADRAGLRYGPGEGGGAPLIFRCRQANGVIVTGIEVDQEAFARIRGAGVMRCRFCGQEHAWELAERPSDSHAPMSFPPEDLPEPSVQNGAYAAHP